MECSIKAAYATKAAAERARSYYNKPGHTLYIYKCKKHKCYHLSSFRGKVEYCTKHKRTSYSDLRDVKRIQAEELRNGKELVIYPCDKGNGYHLKTKK